MPSTHQQQIIVALAIGGLIGIAIFIGLLFVVLA